MVNTEGKPNNRGLKVFLVVLLFFVVSLGLGISSVLYLDAQEKAATKDVVAIVNGKKIMMNDLAARVKLRYSKSLSNVTDDQKKQAVKDLVEYEIVRQEAAKNNFTATDAEITKALTGVTYAKSQEAIFKKDARDYVLKQKVMDRVSGWKSGEYFIIHFDQNFAGPDNESPNQAAIAQDKLNADTIKQRIETGIADGSMDFSAAKALVDGDARFGSKALSTAYVAGSFDKNEFENHEEILQNSQILNTVRNTPNGKVSRMGTLMGNSEGAEKAVGYYMVKISSQSGEGKGYDTWLKDKIKAYKTDILVDYAKDLISTINPGYANAATSSTEADDNLGVRTGDHSDWAGLIVKTYIKVSSTVENPVTVNNIKINNTDKTVKDDGGVVSLSIRDVGKQCSGTAGTRMKTYTFADTYFYKGDPKDCIPTTQYIKEGYLVLGKGYESSSVKNYGNRYVLDCDDDGQSGRPKHNFNIVPPSGITADGKDYTTDYASDDFTVKNGFTTVKSVYYSIKNWNLTLDVSPAGSGTVSGAGRYEDQSDVSVSATSAPGYSFVNWTGDCAGLNQDDQVKMDGNKSCTAHFNSAVVPTIGCAATPSNGLAPLVVKVEKTLTSTATNFDYDMGDGTKLNGKPSKIYYTYSSPGAKTITITEAGQASPSGICSVIVKAPTSTSGGEVAP